jgi:hypothetical protein
MSNLSHDDLSALSHNAEKELKDKPSFQRAASKPHQRITAMLGPALCVTAIGLAVYALWSLFAPPTPSQVSADLSKAMDMASHAVEDARMRDGQLPEALPNASLTTLIGYEKKGTEYRLTGSVGGVLLTLEWDGTRRVEKTAP